MINPKIAINVLILISSIILGCSARKYRAGFYIEENRNLLPPRAQQLLEKDTVCCYSSGFLLRRDYYFPDFHLFFIYQEKGQCYLESFMGYFKLRDMRKTQKRDLMVGQVISQKGPIKIDSCYIFNIFVNNRIDTIPPISHHMDLSTHGSNPEALFIKINKDTICYLTNYESFKSDSTHIRSLLLKLATETIRNANIKFHKKRVYYENKVSEVYDFW